jgi:hypothetical protein
VSRLRDLTHQTFGRLTVTNEAGRDCYNRATWNCICTCGNTVVVRSRNLVQGRVVSCGCYHKEVVTTHGYASRSGNFHSACVSYWAMIDRCYNSDGSHWDDYGGRGIKVCRSWLGRRGIDNFMSDMGPRPKGKTLDRVDVNKGYSRSNCRWALPKTQMNNRRYNVYLTYKGQKKTVSEWCEITGVPRNTAYGRLARGWTVWEAVFTHSARNKL